MWPDFQEWSLGRPDQRCVFYVGSFGTYLVVLVSNRGHVAAPLGVGWFGSHFHNVVFNAATVLYC